MTCRSTTADIQGLRDARGVPTSCSQRPVLDLYEKALSEYQSYVGDPIATIDQALQQEPDFILGHLFRGVAFLMTSEQRSLTEARSSIDSASPSIQLEKSRDLTAVRLRRSGWIQPFRKKRAGSAAYN